MEISTGRFALDFPEVLLRSIRDLGAIVHPGYPWWLSPLLRRGVLAITLGRRIYLSGEAVSLLRAGSTEILRHELVHVEQARRLGLIRFLVRYLFEYVRNRLRRLPPAAAYAAISFEVEAAMAERRAAGKEKTL
ncbi:MAG: DUF4157 domain-containing protein [Thermoanaerobaculia bacterium]